MEKIARELNVTSCWICGGSQMAERWLWRGESVSPEGLLVWNRTHITREKKTRRMGIKSLNNRADMHIKG